VQVRRLRRNRLVQPPALLVGAALGALLSRTLRPLWERWQEQRQQQAQAPDGDDDGKQQADSNGAS
jgi:hypothetical protein